MSTASLMSTEPSSRVIRFSIDLLVAFDYHAGALEQMSELLEVAVRAELLEPRGPSLQLFLPLPGDAVYLCRRDIPAWVDRGAEPLSNASATHSSLIPTRRAAPLPL